MRLFRAISVYHLSQLKHFQPAVVLIVFVFLLLFSGWSPKMTRGQKGMLFTDNKVPAWGNNYSLATDFDGMSKDHPPALFIQNNDDHTAPPQGTLAYAQKLLAINAPVPSIHISNKGGHGFGLCQTFPAWLEICDWPKHAQRFLQDVGAAEEWPGNQRLVFHRESAREHECSLGAVACYFLFMLTRTILMTSSHSEGRRASQPRLRCCNRIVNADTQTRWNKPIFR